MLPRVEDVLLVPGLRSLISIPAGMMQMRLVPFLLVSALGGALWNTLLAAAGRALGQRYAAIEAWVLPAGYAALGVAAGVYVLRVVRLRRGVRR